MVKTLEEKETSKYSPFQWFIFVVFIPLLFAITVGLVVMTFAGINVFEAAKEYGSKLPIISNVFDESSTKSTKQYEKDLMGLEGQIKDREAKIEQLKNQMEDKDRNIDRDQLEKERLQQEIDNLLAIQEDNKRAFKDIIRTYETMSVKKSAPIISKMSDEQALKILTNIKPETLAGIMENMQPAQAARFTELLTNQNENTDGQTP
ncbi:MotE family protein [Neobacillus sp. PS3-34]|uniref:MotE family protein n=1 Tax=Neobacillus sp. PS3-34 TaxID=3070678 RepID=UPI0027E0E578|nr:MotE family protein [Neobacillus sp. PS3-34]WML49280.1 MotE family protein [Neobacillus sp. PS3-34]